MKDIYYCILSCYLFLTAQIQSETSKTLVSSNTLYTADYLDTLLPFFGKSIMQMSSMHKIDEARPIWDVIVQLNNTKGNAMHGFIGFEYQKYSPHISYNIIKHEKPVIGIVDVCKFDESMIENKFIQNSHFQNSDIHLEPFHFDETDSYNTLKIETKHHVGESGVWINMIHLCIKSGGGDDEESLQIAAHQTTINPLGYLGGEYLISLPILAILGIIYCVLSLLWLYWTLTYHQHLLPHIHWFIYFGINIVCVETIFHFYHYKSYNVHGKPSSVMIISDAVCSLILSLYSRIVMVLVSTGYGIVVPHLNTKVIYFLIMFSICYIPIYCMVEKYQVTLLIHEMSAYQHSYQGWIICLAFADCIINWYILENLANIFILLHTKQQQFKLSIYKQLAVVLLIAMIISLMAIIIHLYFEKSQLYTDPTYWCLFWFLRDGVWRFIFLMIGLSIIYIWKPHKHSLKYAYCDEVIDGKTDPDVPTPQMKREIIDPDFDVTTGWTQQIYDAEISDVQFRYKTFEDFLPGSSTSTAM